MQLRQTELLRRQVGVIHRSWNKRRSPTPALSVGLQQAGRQACDGDIMSGSHKTSPGVSGGHAFCFCDFFFLPRSVEGGGQGWGPQLNWSVWPGRGRTFLPTSLIVFSTRCFCHHTQGFVANVTKKCVWRNIPREHGRVKRRVERRKTKFFKLNTCRW